MNVRSFYNIFYFVILTIGFFSIPTNIIHAEANNETECTAAGGECISGETRGGCGTKKNLGRCDDLNQRICCSKSETGIIGTAACESDSKQICSVGADCGSYRTKVGECDNNTVGLAQSCCREVETGQTTTTDSVAASLNYNTLENLPGFEGSSSDFPTYLKNLYLLALWIVGICALFMLVLGGFLYLSSAGNTALISSAKKTITGALIGLVIALITWLILNTINPSLTTIDLNSLSLSGGGTTTGSTGGPTTPAGDTSTCESIKSQVNQCADASSGLLAALGCMAEKLGNQNFTISSISDNAGFLTCQQSWTDAKCAHAQNSCHYGGSAKNPKSCAADISLSSKASQSDIRAAAKACNVAHFDVHGTPLHIHISTNECGCDNGLPTP